MLRREFVGALLSGVAVAAARPALAALPPGAIDVVQKFGFVPDGRTDNYAAFLRWAEHVNKARGGHYVFPAGTYYVRPYRTVGRFKTPPGGVRNAEIVGANGLTITGYGARIVLNGKFHRSGKAAGNDVEGANYSIFMPFEIRRSRNVRIAGFEMDGGVRDMTRDKNVWEAYAYLVALNACSDVSLEDLDLHHSQTDAILLSDDFITTGVLPGKACRNIRLKNVKCHSNARGGLAALQVYGLRAEGCEFSSNGFPGPKYTWHAPGFGVDIEPDRAAVGRDIDILTGNLEFVRCNFYDNFSAILACYITSFTGYCRFIDCNTRNRNNAPNHIIATWPGEGILIQGGDHDAGDGCIWVSWQGGGGKTILRDMRIRSSNDFGILHAFHSLAIVEGCTLTGTHTKPSGAHFPLFQGNPGGGRCNVFRNNRVFIPAARKDFSQLSDVESNFVHTELIDNLYTTDLARPGHHFARVFEGTTCTVRNERFKGAFPGPNDTFRPFPGGTFDTRKPYSL